VAAARPDLRGWPGPHLSALATAIDDAFARWDRGHLHDCRLADGSRLTTPYGDEDELGPSLDDRRTKLSRLRPGEQFLSRKPAPRSAVTAQPGVSKGAGKPSRRLD